MFGLAVIYGLGGEGSHGVHAYAVVPGLGFVVSDDDF